MNSLKLYEKLCLCVYAQACTSHSCVLIRQVDKHSLKGQVEQPGLLQTKHGRNTLMDSEETEEGTGGPKNMRWQLQRRG